jgi:hypothetical protein
MTPMWEFAGLTLSANSHRSGFIFKPATQLPVVLHYGHSIGPSDFFG